MERIRLEKFLNGFLNVGAFEDYGYNGLQVIGKENVNSIAFGVSANIDLFKKVGDVDAVLVHHGLFWKSSSEVWDRKGFAFRINPLLKKRLKFLGGNTFGGYEVLLRN